MILNLLSVFIFGLITHYIFLIRTLSGLFGKKIKKFIKKLLKNQFLSFYVIYFLIILVLLMNINGSVIYCDDVTILTTINDVEISVSGALLSTLCQNLGVPAVFATSMRISMAILAKQKMGVLPRFGAIGLGSTGLTIGYKLVANTLNSTTNNAQSVALTLADVKFKTANASPEVTNNILSKFFNLHGVKIETTIPLEAKNFIIKPTQQQSSEILKQVANQNKNLDWTREDNFADFLANSPLETSDNSFIPNLLDFLTNSMYLQYISLYFVTLAVVIFTCKLIIDNNINLEFIKEFIFGKYIYMAITTYISFWQKSATFWIYFSLFFNWLFIFISAFGTNRVIINIGILFSN